MNWKRTHSLVNIFVVILTLYQIYQAYTFVLPGGDVYQPSLRANILWILTLLGFGWSSIALWSNRSDRDIEIAAFLGITAQLIYLGLVSLDIANFWIRTGDLITQSIGGLITSSIYLLILLTNFYFLSDSTIRDRIFTTGVLSMFEALSGVLAKITYWRKSRNTQRKPKPFYIHAGIWIGESLSLVIVLFTIMYLLVNMYSWIAQNLFYTSNSQNAIVIAIIIGFLLIGGILAQVFVFFRRVNLISLDSV